MDTPAALAVAGVRSPAGSQVAAPAAARRPKLPAHDTQHPRSTSQEYY